MTRRWRIGALAVVLAATGCIDVSGSEDAAMSVTPAIAPVDEP